MGERGYSLVEMLVILGIVCLLTTIGTLAFSQYLHSTRTESQTRMIYTELLKSRADAVYERRATRLRLYPNSFAVYSSAADDATVAPAQRMELRFPVLCNAPGGDAGKGYALGFLDNGLASMPACSICTDEENSASVDSVIISPTRISIGKRQKGTECNAANITIK